MAKIVIAEVDIDSTALLKSATENKKKIDEMKASLSGLKDANGNVTQAYVQQEVAIKKLSTEYNAQKTVLNSLTDSTGKLEKTEQALTNTINKEITSIASARKNNSDLLKVRNELNLATEEGIAAATEINKKIDENNAFIKENVSQYEKQKIGIGDYKTQIVDAIKETGLMSNATKQLGEEGSNIVQVFNTFAPVFNTLNQEFKTIIGNFGDFKKATDESTEATEGNASATRQLSIGQKAYAVATNIATGATQLFALALAATGITIIIGAVALLINYFRQFDPVVDKVEQAFAGVKGVIDFLTESIGSFVSSINSVGDVVSKLGDFFSDPIGSLKEFGKEMGEAASKAAELKARQQDLADQQDINSLANKKEESEIARLLIQAKDRSKTAEEQNALFAKAEQLNREIFERNKKTAAEELSIAIDTAANVKKLNADEIKGLEEKGIAYANYLLNQGRLRQEDYDSLKKAYEAQIDIENQKNEQLDKIVTKQNNALEKQQAEAEAAAKAAAERRQKVLDDAIRINKLELDLFIQSQGIKAKSLEEEIAIAKDISDRKLKIAQAEFAASEKSQADRLTLLKAENDAKLEFLRVQQSAAVANALRELELFNSTNQSLIDGKRFLNDELLNLELDRINKTSEAEAAYQTKRFAEGVINQQEYNDAIREIDQKAFEAKQEVELEREEAQKEKEALDLQTKIETDQLNFDNEFAAKQANAAIAQAKELEDAKKNGADIDLINKKYAAQKKALDKEVADFKLNQEIGIVQGLKGLVGEQTAIGKGLALAEIFQTTFKNASAAFQQAAVFASNPLTAPLAVNANIQGGIIIATGAVQAAKVSGVKFEKGGIARINGKSHAAGGEPVYIGNQYVGEAQGDEGVGILNRGAFAAFMDFNNRNSDGSNSGPGFLAGGGIITQGVQKENLDIVQLAEITIEAVKNLPQPIVGVEDIITAANNFVTVADNAEF